MIYLKLLLTAMFWGGTFVAGRLAAGHMGPFSGSFLRFLFASICLFFVVRQREGRLPTLKKNQIIPVLALGMTGVFFYNFFFFKGLKLIEAGRSSLIIANNPIFIALLSAYFFKEKLNLKKIIGIIISVSGALIAISRGDIHAIINGGVGPGELYIFGAVASWVSYSLIGKQVMKDISPVAAVTWSSIAGTIALLAPALYEGMPRELFHYSLTDWACLFYLGFFGTVIGFVWYYQGIQQIGPMKAGLFINFVPISAISLAFLITGEPITPSLFTGAMLVGAGVFLTNSKTKST